MSEHPSATQLVITAPDELAYPDANSFAARLTVLPADGELVVDLRNVEFMDSCGIRTLILEHRRRQEAGGRIAVRNPSPTVSRLLRVTGVDDILPLG